VIDVGLDDVRIRQRTRSGKRRLHGFAQIDADHFTRAPFRGELRVTSFAAPAFEHDLVAKKLRRDRRDPTEKLLGVRVVDVVKCSPLPTEVLSSRLLVASNCGEFGETWNAARVIGNERSARTATQFAFNDLGILAVNERSSVIAVRTHRRE
jgi:hypothetical protein